MTIHKTAAASAIALLLAAPAFAQGAVVGTDALNDRIDDIETDVDEDLNDAADARRFDDGLPRQGVTGSVALGFTATDGNTETVDLNAAGRVNIGMGLNSHGLGFAIEYGEADGDTNEEELFLVYDYNRTLAGPLYAFALASYAYDDFGTLEDDAFLGGGLGYRIFSEPDLAWRVQAGIGARYTDDDIRGDETTDPAAIIGSRFFYGFSDTVSLTNDTDILYSDEAGTLLRNDFGVNFAITDRASTRISYRTDYNSDVADGLDSTDNRLNVSLVYGF